MDKEKIIQWVERMNAEPNGKKRNEIVADMCKEHGLKIGDAWKLLKEAGFGTTVGSTDTPPGNLKGNSPDKPDEKKQPAILWHKTEYSRYRCAGLVLTQKPETYEVTEGQLEKLKRDCWVEIGEVKAE